MKNLLAMYFCLLASPLVAQNNESSKTITNYASLSFYSELENRLPREYVFVDNFNQFIQIPEEQNLSVFQNESLLNSTDVTGNWMGTSTTSKFLFMNREFESTQIYDLNGVLRQTSVSFSFRKKK
ncbi:MAG: hypothetical protein AAF149_22055 [Bacteroidota bacterium]